MKEEAVPAATTSVTVTAVVQYSIEVAEVVLVASEVTVLEASN